jgi:hypothetical protein
MLVVVVAAFVMLVVSGEIAIVPVLSADHCTFCAIQLKISRIVCYQVNIAKFIIFVN